MRVDTLAIAAPHCDAPGPAHFLIVLIEVELEVEIIHALRELVNSDGLVAPHCQFLLDGHLDAVVGVHAIHEQFYLCFLG